MSDPVFEFGSESGPEDIDELVISVPIGLSSKAELMSFYTSILPENLIFGENWDALADILNDFSWSSAHTVFLLHSDLPLAESDRDCIVYLEILRETVTRWRDDPSALVFDNGGTVSTVNREFRIVFPHSLKELVTSKLAE